MYDLHLLDDAPFIELPAERAEADPQDRLMSAAVLAATAFRMKDMEGLLSALRALTDAVHQVQRAEDAR